MNKMIKTFSIFALSSLAIFAISACGKKKTKTNKTTKNITTKTTTNTKVTTKETKTSFTITLNNSVSGATYNLYSIIDGKKELVDLTKEFKKGDKVIIEIINRSNSNIDVIANSNNDSLIDATIKSKSQKELEEITINDDIDLSIAKSNSYYIDFNNNEYVTFSAYYYDDNNVKHEFTDDFTIDKKTKIFFSMSNDSTGGNMGYIKKNDEYIDYVKCHGKGGHDAVVESFNTEGYEIDSDIVLTSYNCSDYSDTFYVSLYLDNSDLTFTCINSETSEPINIDPSSWSNEVDCFVKTTMTINNPNKRHLAIGINSVDGVKVFDSSDETITINYTFNSGTNIDVEEYEKYNVEITNTYSDIKTSLYTFDSDNIKADMKNGTYPIFTQYVFEVENTSKYDVELNITMYGSTYKKLLHAYEKFSTLDEGETSLFSDFIVEVVKTDVETKFYTVSFDSSTTPSGLSIRLGINRGMYDYPEVEFDSDIASGTELVVVCDGYDGSHTLKVIDILTNEIVKQDSIGGSCAIPFTLTSNVKVVIE